MIPGSANPLLLASAAASPTGYQISRSVRFNAPDSAYLSRTPSVAGNRKTWTWAGWVKRSVLGTDQALIEGFVNSNTWTTFFVNSSNELQFQTFINGSLNLLWKTAAVFRDCSAWYHIVISNDTTQAVSTNAVRIYVNGTQQTLTALFSTGSYLQNRDYDINNTVAHRIGIWGFTNTYFSGYLADVHFIDGQALDPTSFGEFDANGVWQPKAYTGTYPGNSFHLPFSDNSTAAALGTDASGAGNNWTVNNISVAAGAGNDSLVDTPTNYGVDTGAGGEVRGNYATLNPLQIIGTLSNGNLDASVNNGVAYSTIAMSSGKWYFEMTAGSSGGHYAGIYATVGLPAVNTATSYAYFCPGNTTIGIAVDITNGYIWYAINGVWQDSGNPETGANPNPPSASNTPNAATIQANQWVFSVQSGSGADTTVANFGQRAWASSAPSGFKALCTTNLPEPQTITTSGSYTGNGLADGPFVYLNGVPTAMTVNGNAVTFGTQADKLSNGFKLRTTSTTYNQNAATYNYSVTSTGPTFKTARAQSN